MMRATIIGTIWVCQCCMLSHANGECCADDTHGGDSREPLSTLGDGVSVTAGMLWEDHAEDCPNRANGMHDMECDCEREAFTSMPCEGCGSVLAGERHALTLWDESAR